MVSFRACVFFLLCVCNDLDSLAVVLRILLFVFVLGCFLLVFFFFFLFFPGIVIVCLFMKVILFFGGASLSFGRSVTAFYLSIGGWFGLCGSFVLWF